MTLNDLIMYAGIIFGLWVAVVIICRAIFPRLDGQVLPLILAFFLWPAMMLRRAITGRCPMLDKETSIQITQYLNLTELPFDRELSDENIEFIDVSETKGYAFPYQANQYYKNESAVGVANIRPKGGDDYYIAIAFGGELLAGLGPFNSHASAKSAFRKILGQFSLTDGGCSVNRR